MTETAPFLRLAQFPARTALKMVHCASAFPIQPWHSITKPISKKGISDQPYHNRPRIQRSIKGSDDNARRQLLPSNGTSSLDNVIVDGDQLRSATLLSQLLLLPCVTSRAPTQ
jgi:hypothetical protein